MCMYVCGGFVSVSVYYNDFNAAILRNTRAVLFFNGKIND